MSSLSTFLYEAFECPEQFVGHASGIAFEVKDLVRRYRTEVRVVGAIAASRDGDVQIGSVLLCLTFCDSKKQERDWSLLLLRLVLIGGTSPRF
jgi:hypothetical protein